MIVSDIIVVIMILSIGLSLNQFFFN